MASPTILFDLEGTLVQVKVDESPIIEFLMGEVRRRDPSRGATIQRAYTVAETLRQAEGKVERSALEEIRKSAASKLAEAEKASAASARERKDASAAVSSLQGRGIKAWAITGLSEQAAKDALGHANLGAVSIAASRDDSNDQKDRLTLALKKTGSKPEDTILVADTPRDVEAARSAGVRCFVVYSLEVPVNQVLASKPDALLYSIGELGDTLLFLEMRSQAQQVRPPSEPEGSETGTQTPEPGQETAGVP